MKNRQLKPEDKGISAKKMRISTLLGSISIIILLVLGLSAGCSGAAEKTSEESTSTAAQRETPVNPEKPALTVAVSILPQKYLLDQIVSDDVEVVVMVPPGKSPATYEPSPKQIQSLSNASLFFAIGVPFEEAFISILERSLPEMAIVHTDQNIEKRRFTTAHDHAEDDHADDDHADESGAVDPHVWMSPILAQHIAEVMTEEIISLLPQHKEALRNSLEELKQELTEIDAELAELLEPYKGEHMLVYHPAFGYFADRYGLKQEAIETGGNEPSPKQLEQIISFAQDEGIEILFVQPEFNQKSARTAAEAVGGVVVPVSSLQYEYIENLHYIAEEIRKGVKD
ncbi:MAG: zinc ABC transporter substrate-binding protein [Spirochaetales bacterium]|nr:zinc ABC transporter substrate-binding protein [Spirochaetales bacterium]